MSFDSAWSFGGQQQQMKNVVAPLGGATEEGSFVSQLPPTETQKAIGGALNMAKEEAVKGASDVAIGGIKQIAANQAAQEAEKAAAQGLTTSMLGSAAGTGVGEAAAGAAGNAAPLAAAMQGIMEKDYGKAAGSAAGAVAGSMFGPLGTMAGGYLGGAAGHFLGGRLGFADGTTGVGGKGVSTTQPVSPTVSGQSGTGGKGVSASPAPVQQPVQSAVQNFGQELRNPWDYTQAQARGQYVQAPGQAPAGKGVTSNTSTAPVAAPIAAPVQQGNTPGGYYNGAGGYPSWMY
jgi:hypothetical protein